MSNENRAVFLLLKLVYEQQNFHFKQMERKMSELTDAVASVKAGQTNLDTGIGAIITGLGTLEQALANSGNSSPEVVQAISDLKSVAQDMSTQSGNIATALASLPQPAPGPTGATGPATGTTGPTA